MPKRSKSKSITRKTKSKSLTRKPKSTTKVVVAYCLKCKGKNQMKNPKKCLTKRGGKMYKGACSVCETKMAVIVASY